MNIKSSWFFCLGVLTLFVFQTACTKKKADTEITELKVEVLKEGSGPKAATGQTVEVHYTGWLTDGTKFDSSKDRGQPFSFTIGKGMVIQGWEQGVEGMQKGETRKLTIPPSLGYGARQVGPIPANSTLVFEVELLDIK